MSSLDKVLRQSAAPAAEEAPAADLVLALSSALDGLCLYLASDDSDDDGDDDSGGEDDDGDSGHSSHGTYKALIKKGVKPAMAAKMCARSDKKVAASALAESACLILAGLTEPDAAPSSEPTYLGRVVALAAPLEEGVSARKVLAARAAADVLALAAKGAPMGDGGIPMHHPPFTGTHAHSHHLTAAHGHPHQHFGDNSHEGGPQHRPGSKPGTGGFGY